MEANAGSPILYEKLSYEIVGSAIEVHKELGPGLLEKTYERCLCHELGLRGIAAQRQVLLPINYKDLEVEDAYRIDLLVENLVIVEIKVASSLTNLDEAQLMTYLKLSGKRLGILIDFNVPLLKDGVKRIAL